MSRFLLTAMPFTGHVGPMTAVARELVSRGHHVRFYTGSRFRARVEASGAQLVRWQHAPDFDENNLAATFPRLVGEKGIRQLLANVADCFIGTAPAQVEDLFAERDRAPWDLLVADETSVGAVLFAERNRLPWATLAVLPLNLPGPAGPPSGQGLVPGRNFATRTRDAALRRLVPLISRPLVKAMDRAEAAVGLTPRHRTMDRVVFSPLLIIASGAPELDYERADRPAHLHFAGEIAPPASEATLPAWWGDLDGRRVVLVTQGTQNIDPHDLIRLAVQALADLDALVVVTTGVAGRDTLPFPVPVNARVSGYVPFDRLLGQVDVALTNGGWGGTLAMLSHGIPLVIAGGDLDKPEVAARVAWSGAAVNLRTGTPKAAAVRGAVERVLAEPGIRRDAQRVGERLRSLGGAARAADELERAVDELERAVV